MHLLTVWLQQKLKLECTSHNIMKSQQMTEYYNHLSLRKNIKSKHRTCGWVAIAIYKHCCTVITES